MEKIKEMIKRGERGERIRRFIIDAYYYELLEKHERDELLQMLDNAPSTMTPSSGASDRARRCKNERL